MGLVLGGAVVAGGGVAGQRIGLALSLAVGLVLAAALAAAPGRRRHPLWAVAAGLALVPVLRDAGWVVAPCVAGALVAGAAAARPVTTWLDAVDALVTPAGVLGGAGHVGEAVRARVPDAAAARERHGGAVLRGSAAAAVLLTLFGVLFVSADPAFADVAEGLVPHGGDPWAWLWRATLAALVVASGGTLLRRAAGPHEPRTGGRWTPPRTETLIVLGALVTLFAAFVAVQLRVLFGGADYVRATTGLGYGEYARQGFGALVVTCVLALALVAGLASRRDRAVRVLLGALCVLTLVVLASAHDRLALVEDVYGLTRTRLAAHAAVAWLAAVFLLVLAAGASARVARAAPGLLVGGTLVALLAAALANPDGRIADSAVERYARTGQLDVVALSHLSADALGPFRRLPAHQRERVTAALRADLARPDGLLGRNLARGRARGLRSGP